ncbi:Rne/Rng family ribonuclease [Microvirga tunisiensis]|uniref:Ribonuclease E n=1 Tax=Pannonibacter tanglangensis TaxID=2750084 RepID=A0A7X5F1G8_9HYPH|nr:ribonuclease E/G [Pannonibacter sp. XCT-53]NBN78023.1 Rne/Rng family ribonuclease [Pannonibacter sp. XCT-53]
MANKMLIDAAHPEETRVVVVRGNRVEEFDFEAANRKQLRGNIYLAKVTRVEPSLQAAFVEYGGNRHGFLAFSEIHPDYYQIPMADRQALLEDEKAEDERREAAERAAQARKSEEDHGADDSDGDEGDDDADHVESVGAEDALEEVPERRTRQRRQYKIQEVIKRRQVLLVQVVKEERGNKGAALTTYLSLAGRYSVLMPNTGRGGGISRKITQPTDRKRLKKIASELDVPEGMGVILRTAGASRTKAEIKRDFEYLMRLWENVRDLTLKSSAPCLVYEEGSLIKRSIRDLYNKDIDEVLVAGDDGYREAKDFMRMLMPSHAKNVQPYRDATPIFTRFGVEPQLDAMFSPQVTLRSGGYIVINQTEALVSIDVNSGKSTREHNIEDTALQTNLEAAEEITRQLRLRDLAGLIVIDFIDMEENKNNRSVERKLKDCLKNDRARIQVGRISHFGLLEMSRQRIRTGVLESSTTVCPHCHGTGMIRSVESVALHVLRSLEDFLLKGVSHNIIVRTNTSVALYILNQKRKHLGDLEARFALDISVQADEIGHGQHYVLERSTPIDRERVPIPAPTSVQPDTIMIDDVDDVIEEEEDEQDEVEVEVTERPASGEDGERSRRRRRRKRRRGPDGAGQGQSEASGDGSRRGDLAGNGSADGDGEGDEGEGDEGDDERGATGEDGEPKRKRRRGRRGGRRGRRNGEREASAGDGSEDGEAVADAAADAEADGAEREGAGDDDRDGDAGGTEAGDAAGEATRDADAGDEAAAAPAVEAAATAAPKARAPRGRQSKAAAARAAAAAAAEAAVAEAAGANEAGAAADETDGETGSETSVQTGDKTAGDETASPVAPAATDVDGNPDGAAVTEAAETAVAEPAEPAKPRAPATPVVTSERLGDGTPEPGDDDDGKPKRSGWWQRRSFF